jgi:hypothetical protein
LRSSAEKFLARTSGRGEEGEKEARKEKKAGT